MLPVGVELRMLLRLLTLQGSYNYETMVGNGIAFAMEPALRLLPGGRGGEPYRAAIARQSRYFNAHPYLAAIAVGALARAELSLEDPDRIERFRTAACGPLGSVGDRLVWAAWLPLCSLIALLLFGLGASPLATVLTFLATYNAGHLALRAWGLRTGWHRGLGVASALGAPIFRVGPMALNRVAAFVAGIALPLVLARAAGTAPLGVLVLTGVGAAGAVMLSAMHGKVQGWRASFVLLVLATAFAVVAR